MTVVAEIKCVEVTCKEVNYIDAEYYELDKSLTASSEIKNLEVKLESIVENVTKITDRVKQTRGMSKVSTKMQLIHLQDRIESLGWEYMKLKDYMNQRDKILIKVKMEVAYDKLEAALVLVAPKRKTLMQSLGF